jgi:hypothetical protein
MSGVWVQYLRDCPAGAELLAIEVLALWPQIQDSFETTATHGEPMTRDNLTTGKSAGAGIACPLFPQVWFDRCEIREANRLLVAWNHKIGPLLRGDKLTRNAHVLVVGGEPVAVTTTSCLIREPRSTLPWLTRDVACELSRLCAATPVWCRVALRLWREVVFPATGKRWALSYQDADLHTGNTYRFDGWYRVAYSSSGIDTRSGRRGRNKWLWVWPVPPDSSGG